jgi:hypothetical protein
MSFSIPIVWLFFLKKEKPASKTSTWENKKLVYLKEKQIIDKCNY